MRLTHCLLPAFALLTAVPMFLHGADLGQKWVYTKSDFSTDASTDKYIELLKLCKDNGVNFVTLSDGFTNHPDQAPAGYLDNVKRVQAEAKQDNITLVPMFCSIGYGGLYLGHDANLAAGVPARNVPFIIKDGVGSPDAAAVPDLLNADFNNIADDKPAAWKAQEPAEDSCFSSDLTIRHGDTGASLKITNFDKLPADIHDVHIAQVIDGVKPFQVYRLSFWARTENKSAAENADFASSEDFLRITSSDGRRRNSYRNIRIKANSDWTQYEIIFNTFEVPDGKLKIALGAGDDDGVHSGTIWYDDVKLEPAGLLNILRRPNKPLVVTSDDGATTYTEGKDFEKVQDAVVAAKPFRDFTLDHEAPKLVLTNDSRIKEGQKLLVSFFHPMAVYNGYVAISIQDQAAIDLLKKQIENTIRVWPTGHFFIVDDEIRIGGWEVQPEGESLTPGQLLARASKTLCETIKQQSPDATIYVWSDMYNPFQNAKPYATPGHPHGNYYLNNGTYEGSIDGLPKDVVIYNWWAPDDKGPKFFAERGYKQLLAGYYDGDTDEKMKSNITTWMKATEGVEGVQGIMYTTWRGNYKPLPRYFELVKQYPNFGPVETVVPKDR